MLLLLAVTACSKQEEKNTFEDEVVGHWLSSKVILDSVNVTDLYSFDLTLSQNRKFTLTVDSENLLTGQTDSETATGNWTADYVNETITLQNTESSTEQIYSVKYVDDVRMIATSDQNGKNTEITFEKQ